MPPVTAENLRRFLVEVPRYTSYPTAADFGPAVGPAEHAAHLRRAADAPRAPLSLYVHLPFCREICSFCGCHAMVARTKGRVDRYLAALAREMALVQDALASERRVGELHFGGGSPSYLEPADFTRVMTALRERFAFAPDAELALEADPRTIDREKMELYRALGFSRVSFGFQDLDENVQRAIGRRQSEAVSRQAYELARELGFESVNVDLCYGLPEQTEETFARTVREVIALGPDRIALFGYAHLPAVRPRQRLIVADALPGPAVRVSMMAAARQRLVEAGYAAIGLDHFARPGDALARAAASGRLNRNFQGYTTTTTDTLVGLGLSAISDLPGGYAQNFRALPAYLAAVEGGRLPTERGALRSEDDRVRGEIIRRLMCRFTLDVAELERDLDVDFGAAFAPEVSALEALARQGLVIAAPARFDLTDLGRVFVRNVAAVFDAHRRHDGGAQRFSSSS